MKKGLYKHTKDDGYFDKGTIIIEVSETANVHNAPRLYKAVVEGPFSSFTRRYNVSFM